MSKKPLFDQEVRDKIATEFSKNFFVEAGAGSGKTHSLVDRMSGLIRYGHARIENVAAVTFTRKAAAELRERFQIKLEGILHDKATPEPEKDAIAGALSSFERSSISTIHSFCARLLRERPVEAGIDPGFEEIEEEEDGVFALQVWAEYIEKQGFENSKAIGWMQENGISPDSIKDIYVRLVAYPDVEIFREDIKRPDFSAKKKEAEKFIYQLRQKMPATEPAGGWDKLQTTVRRSLKLFELGYLSEDRLFIQLLNILSRESVITQNRWSDKNVAKGCLGEMQKFQADVVLPALRAWKEYLHKPLIEFVLGGVEYYSKWRRERSLLNFQDLLLRSAKLLKENAEVRAFFKKQITHLLVDEFQDTDPIQAELVMLLTGEDNSEDDWRKVKPKPGALFLVGDPKQSIYRFRRADIDIYNQVKSIFKSGAGEVLELTSNFRSFEPIRDITNTVFKGIFPEEDTKYQAKFAPLVTINEQSDKYTGGMFENNIGKVSHNNAIAIAEIDAKIIANWISESVNGDLTLQNPGGALPAARGAQPGDFMIITKTKKRLSIYARALEAIGIPYEISGGENFSKSEELYEIYKVLKAVADPKNQVAIVAAIRGIFFGVSDNDLYQFAKEGGHFSYFVQPEKGPAIIKEAFERLKEYNNIAVSNTPPSAIEKIVEKLGIIPLAMSGEMGSSRAGNILKAIELLRGKRPDTIGSFAEHVEYLKELREGFGVEEMSLFPSTTKAVRLMNLHKAKGLEAPVVILADPGPITTDFEPGSHITRTSKESLGYFTVTKQATGYGGSEFLALPKGWEEYANEEKLYESAERDRLDYVAVTRPKNILVISTYREGTRPKAWEIFFSYLNSIPKLKADISEETAEWTVFTIKEKDWENEKSRITEIIKNMCSETYHSESVTGMVEKPEIFEGEPAGGVSWGSAVHKALEICGKGRRDDLETLGQDILKGEGRSKDDLGKLLKAVDRVIKDDMWNRMLKAKEKYFEVPFSAMKDDTVVMGVMDLIFKEGDGWVLVDYKTDNFEKDPRRKEAYQSQLNMYAELWEKTIGEKIKEKMLYRVA